VARLAIGKAQQIGQEHFLESGNSHDRFSLLIIDDFSIGTHAQRVQRLFHCAELF
jgi:hypothetical protein